MSRAACGKAHRLPVHVDGRVSVDTERAFGWTGGQFVLEGFYESANSLNDHYVGAAEEQSPIDSACCAIARLYQLYYDQKLGSTDLRFGIYDLETEFSNLKPMAVFLSKNLTWNAALDQSGHLLRGEMRSRVGQLPYTPLAAFLIRRPRRPRSGACRWRSPMAPRTTPTVRRTTACSFRRTTAPS